MKYTAPDRRMIEERGLCDRKIKLEGSKTMDQKIYRTMKGAGAANIAIGVVTMVLGLVSGILLIVAGGKLISEKSRILF